MSTNSLGTSKSLDAKKLVQVTTLAGALSIPGVTQATTYQIINGGRTILVPAESISPAPATAKVGMETLGGKSTPVAGATFNTANTTTQIAGGTRDGDNIYGGVKTAVSWNSNIATISVGVARREIDKTQDNYQNAVKAQAGAYHVTQNGTRLGLEAGYQKVNDVHLGSNTHITHSTRTETTPTEIRTINTTTTTTNTAKLHGSSAVTFSGSTSMPIGNNWGATAQVGHTNVNYTNNHKENFSTAKAEFTHYGKTVNISPFVEQNFGDRTDTTAGAKVLYNGKHFQVGAMASHNSTDGNAMSIAIQYPPSEKPNARPKTAQEHRYSLVNNTPVSDMTPHDMAKYSKLVQNQQTRVNEVISVEKLRTPEMIKAEVEAYMATVNKDVHLWYQGYSEYTFDLSGLPNDAAITLVSLTEIEDRGPWMGGEPYAIIHPNKNITLGFHPGNTTGWSNGLIAVFNISGISYTLTVDWLTEK